jgi:hypothetical protein
MLGFGGLQGGTFMRRMRRIAASGRLSATLIGWAALSFGVVTAALFGATSGPALAASVGAASTASTASPPGSAVAFASPSTVTPGTSVTFQVTCGSLQAASATLFGTTLGLPQQIPMDKESSGGVFSVTVTLPASILPGTYEPAIDCSDGSSTTAKLRVTTMPSGGGAQTGDGTTSTATNTGMSAGGLALIAIGAVAGGIALRRRSGNRP